MSGYDLLAEAAIPGVPLETILCTEKLRSRPCRAPDYEKENRALVALASALVDSQSSILQTLAETILEVTQSDSSGLSLLTKDDGGKRFYWAAISSLQRPAASGSGRREAAVWRTESLTSRLQADALRRSLTDGAAVAEHRLLGR